MNIDSIIAEWTYRLDKGYPDCEDDYVELRNVLQEMTDLPEAEQNVIVKRAMGLTEDEGQESNTSIQPNKITNTDINQLVETIRSVADTYARYLKIFNLFDPNSLGTISEVLLAKLIDQAGGQGERVGGSQGLTDVIINGKRISLKTTTAGKPINLASDLNTANSKLSATVLQYARSNEFVEAGYAEKSIKDILNINPDYEFNRELQSLDKIFKNEITARITAIAKKLAGNDEYFVWAAKTMSKIDGKKIITEIKIHVLDYDEQQVIDQLKNGYFFISKSGEGIAWGIRDKTGTIMIGADNDGKYLNVTSTFVNNTVKEKNIIPISLDIATSEIKNNLTPQQLVSDKFLNVLNKISIDLFGTPTGGQATDGENDNLSGREG